MEHHHQFIFFSLRLLLSLFLSLSILVHSVILNRFAGTHRVFPVCDRVSDILSSIIRRTFVRILSSINECNEKEEARKKKKKNFRLFFSLHRIEC